MSGPECGYRSEGGAFTVATLDGNDASTVGAYVPENTFGEDAGTFVLTRVRERFGEVWPEDSPFPLVAPWWGAAMSRATTWARVQAAVAATTTRGERRHQRASEGVVVPASVATHIGTFQQGDIADLFADDDAGEWKLIPPILWGNFIFDRMSGHIEAVLEAMCFEEAHIMASYANSMLKRAGKDGCEAYVESWGCVEYTYKPPCAGECRCEYTISLKGNC